MYIANTQTAIMLYYTVRENAQHENRICLPEVRIFICF